MNDEDDDANEVPFTGHVGEFYIFDLEPLLDLLEQRHFQLMGRAERETDPGSSGIFDLCEDIMGLAFVACQATINHIYPIAAPSMSRRDALAVGPTVGCGVTCVQVIDAAANLWKHRGEWDQEDNAKQRERCIATLRQTGADPTDPAHDFYPLSNIIVVLKDQTVPDLTFLADTLHQWLEALLAKVRA